jgi:hypothetical protein
MPNLDTQDATTTRLAKVLVELRELRAEAVAFEHELEPLIAGADPGEKPGPGRRGTARRATAGAISG